MLYSSNQQDLEDIDIDYRKEHFIYSKSLKILMIHSNMKVDMIVIQGNIGVGKTTLV